ncbi:MAG TPA: Hpt domain-containing protein [Aliiroseovarius sp.]|nr:Hpt domain-containing protein [Aliiroseovarius sp.]
MISWARVNELRDEIGDEDFAEVAAMFLEEVDEVIQRLKSNPVPEQYEEDLHSLKGSALNLGFEALSKICNEGERLAASGDTDAVNLVPVFEIYEKSCAEFKSA